MTFFLLSLLLLAFISLLVAQAAPFPFHNPLPTSTSTPSSVLPSSPSYTTHYERVRGVPYSVSYDERAILINGERVLLLSGSVHYPRFAEAEWAHQLNLTRMSGLNMVQTYVFWNWHEPVKRQYDFTSESHNLGKFLQLAADFGLFVYLRIGPFICSEWAYGGIPLWMREDKSIVYRTNDTKWEYEMTVFVNLIMKYVQPYLARNGGPIILAQIENEYDNMEGDNPGNKAYIQWAGQLTASYASDLAWGMCQSHDAPPPVLSTCNGLTCYDFVGPKRSQPALWTEHWSAEAWTWKWGSHLPHNSAEFMSYAAARYFAQGGSHMNYYMFSGGTTFGRWTGGPLLVNSYDYESPVDEFGIPTKDKFPHLTALHYLLQSYSSIIISQSNGIDRQQPLSSSITLFSYGSAQFGVLFFVNKDNSPQSVSWKNHKVTLSASAVQIFDWTTFELLYDSSNIVLSRRILASHRLFGEYFDSKVRQVSVSQPSTVRFVNEPTALWSADGILKSQKPLELLDISRHVSDHVYYQTSLVLSSSQISAGSINLTLINVVEHYHIFFNSQFIAFGSNGGSYKIPLTGLKSNVPYNLTLVVQQDGSLNCCGGLEAFNEGILGDILVDDKSLLTNGWQQLVGLQGERLALPSSPRSTVWQSPAPSEPRPWVWYGLSIATPRVVDVAWVTYALDLTRSMKKGQVWVNGHAIGRYWNIRDENGNFSQQLNHVPAAWLKREGEDNFVVVLDELGGDPSDIQLIQRV